MSESTNEVDPGIDIEVSNEDDEYLDLKLDSTIEYYGVDEEELKNVDFSKCMFVYIQLSLIDCRYL